MKLKKIKKPRKALDKVQSLFHASLEVPAEERERFLDSYPNAAEEVKAQVRELLSVHEEDVSLPQLALSTEKQDAYSSILGSDLSQSPTLIGPYLLLQRIDSGGMAEVYLARKKGARGFEKEVALKCVLPRHVTNSRIQRWFEEEAKLGARLNHPNIVQIHDFVQLNESYWLVMEYIRGKNLNSLIQKLSEKKSVLPFPLSAYLCCEIFKALEYAHHWVDERTGKLVPVIHRDISPKNLILSFSGDLKVVDYGIAKVDKENKRGDTQTGLVMGTPGYMSPEQGRGEKLTVASDIYSASLVLYTLLAGKPLVEILKNDQESSPEFPKTESRYHGQLQKAVDDLNLSEPLKETLLKGLAWKASERPNALKCRMAIEAAYRGEPQFGQQTLRNQVETLFFDEIAEEKTKALEREMKIEAWRARGLLNNTSQSDPNSKVLSLDLDSWKRSPLIIGLLSLTLLTTAFNVFLQVVPDTAPISKFLFGRQLASFGLCTLNVESKPSNAVLYANHIHLGLTPAKLRTECGEKVHLELHLEGYQIRTLDTKASEIEKSLYFDLAK